jgi:hypothetical protein
MLKKIVYLLVFASGQEASHVASGQEVTGQEAPCYLFQDFVCAWLKKAASVGSVGVSSSISRMSMSSISRCQQQQ